MACDKCGSKRVMSISSKASDCSSWSIGENSQDGYLPRDLGIGGGDYVDFSYCLDCGKIQGEFPHPETGVEQGNDYKYS